MISIKKNSLAVGFLAVLFPVAALADLTGTITLSANTRVSMDTGATVNSGGDFLWTGTTLTPQGSAKALNATALAGLAGSTGYTTLTQSLLSSFAALGSSAALTSLAANTVVGYETNGGNFGKFLVTAVSGTSISLEYTTYGVSGSGSGAGNPTITQLQNNYGLIAPGLPNYGIAPGSLFIIRGSNLSSVPIANVTLQSSAGPAGIPTTLNGAAITVTVNGTTVHPGIYYAGSSQIAAVLPSNTPIGTGTITVTYSGATVTSPITVVPTALGLDTYYGSGTGLGVATDPVTGALFNYTNSIPPGKIIVLWGSGLGADTADSDTVYTTSPHAVNTPLTIYFGGVAGTVLYAGSGGYPGVNQINVMVPANAPTGCGVSVVAVSGNIVSNTVSLPIGNGVCSDGVLGYNGTQLTTMSTQTGTYNFGSLAIEQITTPGVAPLGGTNTDASGIFEKVQYSGSSSTTTGGVTSLGSCSVITASSASTGTIPTIVGLDAGTITITGPTGTQTLTNQALPTQSGPSGLYTASLASSFMPPTGGTYTFTGSGGADVGHFTTSISYTSPLVWTNMNAVTTVNRASGQPITWTGGAANSYVVITGSSANATASASFFCYAPASAGQFTVPSYVLLALPASTNNSGSLGVENAVTGTFTATGLTTGTTIAAVSFGITPTYN